MITVSRPFTINVVFMTASCALNYGVNRAEWLTLRLHGNLYRCTERFALDRFPDLLGALPGAYDRGNDLMKRVTIRPWWRSMACPSSA